MLEPRDVPAGYWWNPVGTADFNDPGDWMKGPGAPWDRYTLSDPAPGPTSDLYFDGGVTTASCVIPSQYVTSGNAFAGIHLQFGYYTYLTTETEELPGEGEGFPPPPPPPPPPVWRAYSGTVTLSNGFDVGTLDVECGAISQGSDTVTSGNGTTLTVTSFLDWTGGTLNNNSVAGTIALAPGATGIAEPSFTNPGIDGKVFLGSKFILQGNANSETGSQLQMMDGVYTLTHAQASFTVSPFAGIEFLLGAPVPSAPREIDGTLTIDHTAVSLDDFEHQLSIQHDAKGYIRSRNNGSTPANARVEVKARKPFISNEGRLEISDKTELRFTTTNDVGGLPYTGEDGGYIQDTAPGKLPPTLLIEAGSSITCHQQTAVYIKTGNLILKDAPPSQTNPAPYAYSQPAVTIASPDELYNLYTLWLGETATLEREVADGTLPSNLPMGVLALNVDGNVQLDGTVHLYLHHATDTNDKITASGWVTFGGNAKLRTHWYSDPIGQMRGVTQAWTVVESTYAENLVTPVRLMSGLLDFDFHHDQHPSQTVVLEPWLPAGFDDQNVLKVRREE